MLPALARPVAAALLLAANLPVAVYAGPVVVLSLLLSVPLALRLLAG